MLPHLYAGLLYNSLSSSSSSVPCSVVVALRARGVCHHMLRTNANTEQRAHPRALGDPLHPETRDTPPSDGGREVTRSLLPSSRQVVVRGMDGCNVLLHGHGDAGRRRNHVYTTRAFVEGRRCRAHHSRRTRVKIWRHHRDVIAMIDGRRRGSVDLLAEGAALREPRAAAGRLAQHHRAAAAQHHSLESNRRGSGKEEMSQ